jgi:hypothetical protein
MAEQLFRTMKVQTCRRRSRGGDVGRQVARNEAEIQRGRR